MSLIDSFEPLDLRHKPLLDQYFRLFPPEISELTFTNLWVWSLCHSVWACEENGTLFLLRKAEGPNRFYGLLPLGEKPAVEKCARLVELMRKQNLNPCLERIPATVAEDLAANGFLIREDRDQFDYVYARTDLAELKGRKYHRKRNHITKCLDHHRIEYEPFCVDHIQACRGFLDEWCRIRQCEGHADILCEIRAIHIMLRNWDALAVIGGVLRVDGDVAAVTFAERLNADTAVVHFEKAHPEIDGLYPLINQQFCEKSLPGFTWINREQDLGLPGLRQAKENYFPSAMVIKYTATPVS